ncbi:MFS transporter [Paracoccus pacificus]|uniref:MFS transporter n=1 Tax=Paracoccus pacificus TaxID=1463598 RepID=A0ABW4R696_9RHOB
MSYQKIPKCRNFIRTAQTLALLAGVMLVGSNAFVLSPILSDVAQGLGTEPSRIAWAISVFGAATAVSGLTLARMIDSLPAGNLLGGAALVLALAQASSGASPNWVWLCVSQGLAGMATGLLLPGVYATAAASATQGREAARLGAVLTGWALSLVLMVPLAAFIAEGFGWRMVYAALSGLSLLTAFGMAVGLRGIAGENRARTSLSRALRLPGVARLLLVIFVYMTAFYGSFAFFGEGVRQTFALTARGTGILLSAYGLGFGLAGIGLAMAAPSITRRYLTTVLLGIAASYLSWRFALKTPASAFIGAVVWGIFNQLGLNALVVSLNQRAAQVRGAVMGLNTAVTYSAVFAGPMLMGPIFADRGFVAVGALAAGLVLIGALLGWKAVQAA